MKACKSSIWYASTIGRDKVSRSVAEKGWNYLFAQQTAAVLQQGEEQEEGEEGKEQEQAGAVAAVSRLGRGGAEALGSPHLMGRHH